MGESDTNHHENMRVQVTKGKNGGEKGVGGGGIDSEKKKRTRRSSIGKKRIVGTQCACRKCDGGNVTRRDINQLGSGAQVSDGPKIQKGGKTNRRENEVEGGFFQGESSEIPTTR